VILITKENLEVHEFFEEEKHRCEVRQVLKWRVQDRTKAMEYLALVEKRRGEIAANKLRNDSRIQWERGNRGIDGNWK
jgi:hypothetical protein